MTADENTSGAEIAAELRLIAEALHSRAPGPAAAADLLDCLRSARGLLASGERRIRWYEDTVGEQPGIRARNRELSPWSGAVNAAAPPMVLEVGEHESGVAAIIGRVELDRLREGPPGAVHGGVVAGLFDEVLGAANRQAGIDGAVTGRLTVRFRKPTPLATPLIFRAWVDDLRTTRVMLRADCRIDSGQDRSGRPTAEADAIFVRLGLGLGGGGSGPS